MKLEMSQNILEVLHSDIKFTSWVVHEWGVWTGEMAWEIWSEVTSIFLQMTGKKL
jgi:hypothetical protein